MSILWPLDNVRVTGEWANSPKYYKQFGQSGHNGIDLAASIGTPVYATDSGTVVAEGWGSGDSWMGSIAGIFVRIRHSWGYSAYAHLSSTIVNVGQKVNRGQLIGYSGATGVGTGPHLHFETFPLSPNFGNGFAGRVNPRFWGLVSRGSNQTPPAPKPPTTNPNLTPERNKKMDYASVCYKLPNGSYLVTVFCMGNGEYHEYQESSLSYIYNIAKTYQCGPNSIITKSHHDAIRRQLAATRDRLDKRKG